MNKNHFDYIYCSKFSVAKHTELIAQYSAKFTLNYSHKISGDVNNATITLAIYNH